MVIFQFSFLISISIIFTSVIANPAPADQEAVDACAGSSTDVKCLGDGSRFVICNSDYSIAQAVAAGQICKDGKIIAAGPNDQPNKPANNNQPAPRPPHPPHLPPQSPPSPPPPPPPEPAPAPAPTPAPDPCFLGGNILSSDVQDDSCTGDDGSIECRSEYMYVRCNVGKIPRCRAPMGKKCRDNKLNSTYQA